MQCPDPIWVRSTSKTKKKGAGTCEVACNRCIHVHVHVHVYVIVVSWFLQCMGYVPHEGCTYFQGWSLRKYIQHKGGTIPMHCKNHEQLTCTDRPYKANCQISFSGRMSSTYCTLAVQRRKIPYARRCSYSSTSKCNLERDCIRSRRDEIGITRHIMMHQVLYNVTLFVSTWCIIL